MTNWADVLVAVVAALSGGGVIKLIENWLNKGRVKNEQDKQFRDELKQAATELRQQIEDLKEELKVAEKEMEDWKRKYWDVYLEYKSYQIEVRSILSKHGIDMSEIQQFIPEINIRTNVKYDS